MELVNSKEKLLKGPEIVAMSAYNMPDLKYPKEVVLAAVAAGVYVTSDRSCTDW